MHTGTEHSLSALGCATNRPGRARETTAGGPCSSVHGFIRHRLKSLAACLVVATLAGCTFNYLDRGMPVTSLPHHARQGRGVRSGPGNLAMFAARATEEHVIGPRDVLSLYVRGLEQRDESRPILLRVLENGTVLLPVAGPATVGGMTLAQAEQAITQAYSTSYLKDPFVRVELVQPRAKRVVVLGEVRTPGVYDLPADETDVLHALAKAGGLTERAEQQVQIHRRVTNPQGHEQFMHALGLSPTEDKGVVEAQAQLGPMVEPKYQPAWLGPETPTRVITVPLKGTGPNDVFDPNDLRLEAGDVVMVDGRGEDIFFVSGAVEKGGKFDLPRDREIDVLGAVAMAGGPRAKSNPTRVTVVRRGSDGRQTRIATDLRWARRNPSENLLLQPGDVVVVDEDLASYLRELLKDSLRLSFDLGTLFNSGSGQTTF